MSRHRKTITSSSLVNSIDSALDPDNYEEITYLNKDGCWEKFAGYLGPKSNKAMEKQRIFWSSDIPSCSGQQRQCDIIESGKHSFLLGRAKHIETIEDAFDLLFDEEMFSLRESKVNENIKTRTETLTKQKEHLFESSKYPWIKPTIVFELRALIGLLYFRGLFGMNHHSLNILFSDKAGHPVFGAAISRDRMKYFLSTLTFDDPETRKEKWPHDCFAASRPIFEMFNSNTSKYLLPSLYLSIDETLYPMRHQIAFWQYNPSKPHRYGLLLKSLNDASFAYTYNACSYAGKPEKGEGPHYIDSIENYVRYLVNQTANDVELQGRNISMDRLYTILSLANWLLGRKITCVGTLNHNRQGIPTELKNTSERVEFSVTYHYESVKKDLCLLSYTVKTKSSSKNNVLLLFTMRLLNGITREDNKQKPSIYKFYDFTKGGTDIADQLNDYYTVRSQSNSWDLVSFYYILDTIRVNSKTLFCIKKGLDVKKENTFNLAFELAKVLTCPFIEQRRINGLGKSVIEN